MRNKRMKDKEQNEIGMSNYIKPLIGMSLSAAIIFGGLYAMQNLTKSGLERQFEQATSEEVLTYMANVAANAQVEESENENLTDETGETEVYIIDDTMDNSEQVDHTETSAISANVNYKLSYFNNAIVDGIKVKNEYDYLSLSDYAVVLITKDMIANSDELGRCQDLGEYLDHTVTLNGYNYNGVTYPLTGLNFNSVLENTELEFKDNYFNVKGGFLSVDDMRIYNPALDGLRDDSTAIYVEDDATYFSYLMKNEANEVVGIVFIENIFN